MRVVIRIVLLVVVVLATSAVPAAANRHGPQVLRPKWRLVAGAAADPAYIAAGDRYGALLKNSSSNAVQLIDEQAHQRRTLSAPDCPSPNYPDSTEAGGPIFGGPWLIVSCGFKFYELYDLASGEWRSFTASPQCGYNARLGQGACAVVGVGRYWVKFFTTDGSCVAHCGVGYYLQNILILTGEFKPDPVTPGGQTFDDLSAPSGSRALCPPLRYPRIYDGSIYQWEPGSLSFYGQFALAVGVDFRLRRCGSRLNLRIPHGTSPTSNGPAASSRAVIWSPDEKTLLVRFLPSLQLFKIRPPAASRIRPPGSLPNGVDVAAVSKRTIYVRIIYGGQLWAVALRQLRRQPRR